VPSLDAHIALFGRPPTVAATDRGFSSAPNEQYARDKGVKYVSMPKRGKKTDERRRYEKQRWFRRAQRFRAGSEGRISVLKRRFGLDLCRYNGQEGFDRWLGLGAIPFT
jgi:IS5 family transposase